MLFARNLLIARLVSPTDFALALTLGLSASLVQMMTDLGLDRFIIQDPNGGDPDVIKTVHAANLIRGILVSVVLFSLSPFIAGLFGVSEVYWAYQILALILSMRAIENLDVKRIQRDHRFGRDLTANVVAQAAGLFVGLVAALKLGSFVAMLWAIGAQTLCLTLLTHAFAERHYACGFDQRHVKRLLIFGWPLIVNGLVLFAGSQGDRVLVGSALSLEDLAIYGAATTVTGALSAFVIKVIATVSLPKLAEISNDEAKFSLRMTDLGALVLVVSISLSLAIGFTAKGFIEILFGARYQIPEQLPVFLGLVAAFWVAQIWPTLVALSKGQTKQVLVVNLVRISGILFAGASILTSGTLVAIAAAIAAGEVIAFLLSYWLVRRYGIGQHSRPGRIATIILCGNLLVATVQIAMPQLGFLVAFGVALFSIAVLVGVTLYIRPNLRPKIRDLI